MGKKCALLADCIQKDPRGISQILTCAHQKAKQERLAVCDDVMQRLQKSNSAEVSKEASVRVLGMLDTYTEVLSQ